MSIILFFALGFIVGLIPTFIIIRKNKKIKNNLPIGRLGLIEKNYYLDIRDNISKYSGGWGSVDVQYEVEEISSTDKLSKIKVKSIIVKSTINKHNTSEFKSKLLNMINNNWINTSDIEWLTTAADIRDSKINQILN